MEPDLGHTSVGKWGPKLPEITCLPQVIFYTRI
ncbi:permeases of the major facilitator superfamily [Moorella thermoacetica Y72]|uniref:Permeases of the major facilitator superfamily n=1 Tax=Moorella thermoacetica Y72 TaxID=1325331 RepID=A0A0S6UDM3_NEOTH|nr:permeases of the major facilitator superfamily [Moorella thermoacetica Y72]